MTTPPDFTTRTTEHPTGFALSFKEPGEECVTTFEYDKVMDFKEAVYSFGLREICFPVGCGARVEVEWEHWLSPLGRMYRIQWEYSPSGFIRPIAWPTIKSGAPMSYVYLMKIPMVGVVYRYKIGISKDPKERVRTMFSTRAPIDLKLICWIRTTHAKELEKDLHQRYADKRGDGEWFALEQCDVRYIRLLARSTGNG